MLAARTFLVWKDGDQWDDCQDSIYPMPDDLSGETYAYAVADGVSTSFFSRRWARILTRKFGENPERVFEDWQVWLEEAQAEWQLQIEKIAHSGKANFIVANGFRAKKPAAATFIGLTLTDHNEDGWTWRAALVGDSCLFKLGKDGDVSSWNIKSSTEFCNVVPSVESWPRLNPYAPTQVGSAPFGSESPIRESDSVILATDALAKWLLKRHELGQPVWGTILKLERSEDFEDLVRRARSEEDNSLQNDDVALATLSFGAIHPVFAEQTFTPRPRSTEPKSEAADPVILRNLWEQPDAKAGLLSSSLERTDRIKELFSRTGSKFVLQFTGILLVLLGLMLLQLMKRSAELKHLTRENQILRDQATARTLASKDRAIDSLSISALEKESDAFHQAVQAVSVFEYKSSDSEQIPPDQLQRRSTSKPRR